jgi:hypothetical protein
VDVSPVGLTENPPYVRLTGPEPGGSVRATLGRGNTAIEFTALDGEELPLPVAARELNVGVMELSYAWSAVLDGLEQTERALGRDPVGRTTSGAVTQEGRQVMSEGQDSYEGAFVRSLRDAAKDRLYRDDLSGRDELTAEANAVERVQEGRGSLHDEVVDAKVRLREWGGNERELAAAVDAADAADRPGFDYPNAGAWGEGMKADDDRQREERGFLRDVLAGNESLGDPVTHAKMSDKQHGWGPAKVEEKPEVEKPAVSVRERNAAKLAGATACGIQGDSPTAGRAVKGPALR